MKTVQTVALALVLTAFTSCAPKPPVEVTVTKYVVVTTPQPILDGCPQTLVIPDPNTLTNQQVAELITTLYSKWSKCAITVRNIKAFQDKEKAHYAQTGQKVPDLK